MTDRLNQQMAFLIEADKLKSVLRATTLADGSRRENSGEHSWHLALYALVLADHAPQGVDINRVIKMLLLHDLVEIDVGDVPIHSAGGTAHNSLEIQAAEAQAAHRIFGLLPVTCPTIFAQHGKSLNGPKPQMRSSRNPWTASSPWCRIWPVTAGLGLSIR